MTYEVTAAELRKIVEQIESIEAQIAGLNGDKADAYTEAKHRGYDTQALRLLVKLRKANPEKIAEQEAILDLYRRALEGAA